MNKYKKKCARPFGSYKMKDIMLKDIKEGTNK